MKRQLVVLCGANLACWSQSGFFLFNEKKGRDVIKWEIGTEPASRSADGGAEGAGQGNVR